MATASGAVSNGTGIVRSSSDSNILLDTDKHKGQSVWPDIIFIILPIPGKKVLGSNYHLYISAVLCITAVHNDMHAFMSRWFRFSYKFRFAVYMYLPHAVNCKDGMVVQWV